MSSLVRKPQHTQDKEKLEKHGPYSLLGDKSQSTFATLTMELANVLHLSPLDKACKLTCIFKVLD
jgi:hypothetical protein